MTYDRCRVNHKTPEVPYIRSSINKIVIITNSFYGSGKTKNKTHNQQQKQQQQQQQHRRRIMLVVYMLR